MESNQKANKDKHWVTFRANLPWGKKDTLSNEQLSGRNKITRMKSSIVYETRS